MADVATCPLRYFLSFYVLMRLLTENKTSSLQLGVASDTTVYWFSNGGEVCGFLIYSPDMFLKWQGRAAGLSYFLFFKLEYIDSRAVTLNYAMETGF